MPKDGEINPGIGNYSQKTPPLLLSSYHRNLNIISNEEVLHKPETSGRLMKWAIELSEFNIKYKPKTVIKGQILADFVMEFTSTELTEATELAPDLPIWKFSVDGEANAQGSDAGLILTFPDGIDTEFALRFSFRASNNEAEYEAVLTRLNLVHFMEADQLEVSSDSQLVVK